MNQHAGVIEQVLDRVHRQAGPGSDVDVPVMHVMRDLVEDLHMQQAVRPVEVEVPPERHEHENHQEPDRLRARVDEGDYAICIGPEHDHLEAGPNRASADDAPENVIAYLVVPQEFLALAHPARRPLVLVALRLIRPKADVQNGR